MTRSSCCAPKRELQGREGHGASSRDGWLGMCASRSALVADAEPSGRSGITGRAMLVCCLLACCATLMGARCAAGCLTCRHRPALRRCVRARNLPARFGPPPCRRRVPRGEYRALSQAAPVTLGSWNPGDYALRQGWAAGCLVRGWEGPNLPMGLPRRRRCTRPKSSRRHGAGSKPAVRRRLWQWSAPAWRAHSYSGTCACSCPAPACPQRTALADRWRRPGGVQLCAAPAPPPAGVETSSRWAWTSSAAPTAALRRRGHVQGCVS